MSHPFAPVPALEPATEFYWRAGRDGRLAMLRCTACRWIVHPPQPVCARCRHRTLEEATLSGRGTIVSFTVNHQPWMPGLEVPFVLAIVELAEQRDLRLTTRLVDVAPDAVAVGQRVAVTFEPVGDDAALPLFRPDDTPWPAVDRTPDAPPTHTATAPSRPLPRVMPAQRLEQRAVLSGVGQSAIGRRLHRTAMDLTVEAALRALDDAGLSPDDVDGIASYPGFMPGAPQGFAGPGIVEVQDALGLSVTWHQAGPEGAAQLNPIIAASLAVGAGLARHVLVYRTVTEATASASTGRLGIGAGSREIGGFSAHLVPFGAMSAANWLAMYAVRHMHAYGTRREHLGAVALAGRKHAALNPDAVYRTPMTMDDYLGARLVSWPFGLYDCDAPCDGSTVVLVSAAEAARDLRQRPVRIEAVGTAMRSRPSWDQWEDLTTMAARDAGAQLWTRTDLTPDDVDVAQLYDGFSFLTLVWLEALGFCGKGEAGPFVEGGRLELGGALPTNTWGGQLSGGRLHGFGFVAEAMRQLRGTCGARQVPDAEVAVVANGGGPIAGCMLLTRG